MWYQDNRQVVIGYGKDFEKEKNLFYSIIKKRYYKATEFMF